MTGNGELFAYIGAFILWLFRLFKGEYRDVLKKNYTVSFIIGFLLTVGIILLIERLW